MHKISLGPQSLLYSVGYFSKIFISLYISLPPCLSAQNLLLDSLPIQARGDLCQTSLPDHLQGRQYQARKGKLTHEYYPLHRMPQLRVQVDLGRKENDKPRQLRNEPLLKKGPGKRERRLPAEGLKPEIPSPSAPLN